MSSSIPDSSSFPITEPGISDHDGEKGLDWNRHVAGESYCDNDPVYRSVDFRGLNGNPLFEGYPTHSDANMSSQDGANMLGDCTSWSKMPVFEKQDSESGCLKSVCTEPNFTDRVRPVEFPVDCQTNTSVILKNVSAARMTQFLHQLLTKNYKSSIAKVREEKFAITGIIFYEVGPCLSHCAMKVQIFRPFRSTDKGEQNLIVQFRRKKGDVVAFNHIFRKVSSKLQEHANILQTGFKTADNVVPHLKKLDLPDLPALPMLPIGIDSGSDVQPLLNMLVDNTWPIWQIEAMIGLAELLASANVAIAMVIISALKKNLGVYQQLEMLGASPEFELSYPAKLIVSQLRHYSGGNSIMVL